MRFDAEAMVASAKAADHKETKEETSSPPEDRQHIA
jgi:hypothetical protein